MAETKTVEITARDLPLQCPPAGVSAWNQHPRVFLDVSHTGEAICPYCRARYVYKGRTPQSH